MGQPPFPTEAQSCRKWRIKTWCVIQLLHISWLKSLLSEKEAWPRSELSALTPLTLRVIMKTIKALIGAFSYFACLTVSERLTCQVFEYVTDSLEQIELRGRWISWGEGKCEQNNEGRTRHFIWQKLLRFSVCVGLWKHVMFQWLQ